MVMGMPNGYRKCRCCKSYFMPDTEEELMYKDTLKLCKKCLEEHK